MFIVRYANILYTSNGQKRILLYKTNENDILLSAHTNTAGENATFIKQ